LFVLDDLHGETGRRMKGDMAMEDPGTRVIRLKRNDHKAASGEHYDVPPRRVDAVDVRVLTIQLVWRELAFESRSRVVRLGRIVVPRVFCLVEDRKIVPMQMHRVRRGEECALATGRWERHRGPGEDHPDPLIFDIIAVSDDVKVGTVSDECIDLIQAENSRIAEIDAKGVGVNGPSKLEGVSGCFRRSGFVERTRGSPGL